jgi:peptide/nickel transport system ATP-binding protein
VSGEAPLLAIEGLTVALPKGGDRPHAVLDLSLGLARDEILCIVGESGSGKSITAQAVMGLLPLPHVRPTAGRILFEGLDLLRLSPDRLRRIRGRRIAMIFQEPMTALNPVLPVGDQIAEMIGAHERLPREALASRVVELLQAVNLPEPQTLRHAFPFRLSGGQRQRVMIAMALALGPAILIADEPTTALDVTTQAQILRLIKRLQAERGMGVMFVTHDFGVVAEIADRVAVMREGRVVELGTRRDVLERPQHPYTRSLIAAVPRLRRREARAAAEGVPLLRLEGVDKTFRTGAGLFRRGRTVHAVDRVDLEVRRGETLGVVGESGSGKSTLARCVVRLVDADGGRIEIAGTDLAPLRGRRLQPHRRRVQMIFQDPYASLNPRQTVGTIIGSGLRLYGIGRTDAQERTRRMLALVGLDAKAEARYPHEFSGGQRQRIAIARALVLEPELLVADEPVSSLDVSVQAQVLALLDDIRARLGLTMLFITHDLRVAAQVCDRIAVMRHGRVVETGPTARVFEHPEHPYTRELLGAIPGRSWFERGAAA